MTPPNPPAPDACAAFRRAADAVLDGTAPVSALGSGHAAGCADCSRLAAAVRVLLGGLEAARREPLPGPPPDFAAVVVAKALRERRLRKARLAGGLLVAAGVALAVVVGRPAPPPTVAPVPVPELALAPADPPLRVSDKLAEAGTALAALTRRTAEETVAPVQVLVPAVAPVDLDGGPMVPGVPDADPAVESLARIPEAASAGLEPVAESAKRAVFLFLRDTGLAAAKPTS